MKRLLLPCPGRGRCFSGRFPAALISPYARRRAKELQVDLARVQLQRGTGIIHAADVERAASESESLSTDAANARRGLPGARHSIAAAMERSKREIPHYYLTTAIDFYAAQAWLEQRNRERSIRERLLAGALLVRAVALATRKMIQFNASFEHGEILTHDSIHVGTAISLRGGGLVAPAVHNADQISLDAIMAAMQDLVARARSGSLRSSEFSDSTITVTSLGERGVEIVTPIIVPPQTAILGFGRIVTRPWVVDGSIVARPIVYATLAGDHRVTDGHLGGRYLALVDQLLQKPADL